MREINAQFYRLTGMYNQIKAAADPRTRIYVIGYPQIAVPDGTCALNVHLNNDEIISVDSRQEIHTGQYNLDLVT